VGAVTRLGEAEENNCRMASAADSFLLGADRGPAQAVEVDFNDDDSDSTLEPNMHMLPSDAEQREQRLGFPILNVYSVRFLEKDEKVLPHIFGVIAIQGASGASIIFNRKVGEPRLVDSEVTLLYYYFFDKWQGRLFFFSLTETNYSTTQKKEIPL
jgi:hypothetical protein